MSQMSWAKGILLKSKKEDKSRAKKRVKRQAKRQAKSLIRIQGATPKLVEPTPVPESTDQK
jgi:hypothetical protein